MEVCPSFLTHPPSLRQLPDLAHGRSGLGAGGGSRAATTTDVIRQQFLLAVLEELKGFSLCFADDQSCPCCHFLGVSPPPKAFISALPMTQASHSDFLLQFLGHCRQAAASRSPLGYFQPRGPQLITRKAGHPGLAAGGTGHCRQLPVPPGACFPPPAVSCQ